MKILIFIIFLLISPLILSWIFKIPYIYTILGFSLWAFVGHLITLDDDSKDGWSNQENRESIWLKSKKELIIKFIIFILIISIILIYPEIKKFGA